MSTLKLTKRQSKNLLMLWGCDMFVDCDRTLHIECMYVCGPSHPPKVSVDDEAGLLAFSCQGSWHRDFLSRPEHPSRISHPPEILARHKRALLAPWCSMDYNSHQDFLVSYNGQRQMHVHMGVGPTETLCMYKIFPPCQLYEAALRFGPHTWCMRSVWLSCGLTPSSGLPIFSQLLVSDTTYMQPIKYAYRRTTSAGLHDNIRPVLR
jgi:ssDNA-binding Zn-finger/Zn-ribbon topoisomerase 1